MSARISAGDVDRFVYCPLNWKRAREGEEGLGGQAGVAAHSQRASRAESVGEYQKEARWSLETSFLLALVAISGATLALELIYLDFDTSFNWILVLLAVMWVASSLLLFAYNLYFRGRAEQLGRSARLVPGDVAYVDKEGERRPESLTSRMLPLDGRPDYVVERDGRWVPVEVKTGRTPRWPYDSHVLQVAAYCHLVEQERGVRPAFGVVEYPERSFEVPYTEALETELVKTLLRIQLAERTGQAHRNHNSKPRCAGCARRVGCPERLDVKAPVAAAAAAPSGEPAPVER